MVRRGSYSFDRKRKGDLRRAKQEAKRQRKSERPPGEGPEIGEAQESGPPEGMWEWFSPSRNRVQTCEARVRPAAGSPDDWILLTDVAEGEAPTETG